MKLTKYQKARLLEYNWDVVNADDGQNCNWIEVNKNNNELLYQGFHDKGSLS